MKTIRNILIAFAAIFAPLVATAQVDQVVLSTPANISVAATTTNTTFASSNWVATVTRSTAATVGVSAKLTGAGTSAVVFKFDTSLDNVNWQTGALSASITPAGTTAVTAHTALTLGGIPYIRLSSVENPNASAVTNITIRVSAKRGS